jgi:transcriptional regulator with XRE-family HTH domain
MQPVEVFVDAPGDNLCDQLREEIRNRGLSEFELSRATGVEHVLIVHFLRGKDLGIKRAARLAAFLGLQLRPKSSDRP